MSGINSLLDRLRSAYAAIAEVEEVAARIPKDQFVFANLVSLKRDAEDLEGQLSELALRDQKEVCRYRLLPTRGISYALASVTKSLLDFQELFSQIYDAQKRGGGKTRARLAENIVEETQFDFGFSYPGSLGVVLLAQGESGFFVGKYDFTIDAFMEIPTIKDEDGIRDMSHSLGEAVVKKVYDWSLVNASAGYSVDIDWTTSRAFKKGGTIEAGTFGKIVEIISRTSDIEKFLIRANGLLIGIDAKTRRFRFVSHDGKYYSGTLSETFPIKAVWSINTSYTAEIETEVVTEYASGRTQESYRLRWLQPNLSA
jgi:hypothetical protein